MKAILVVDAPKRCLDCELISIEENNEIVRCFNGRTLDVGDIFKERPSWCPLKHPLKAVDNDFYIYDRRYLFDNLDREITLLMSAKRFEEYMKAKGETE